MNVQRIFIVLLTLVVPAFMYLGTKDALETKDRLDFQKIELKSKQSDIKELNMRYNKLNVDLDKAQNQKGDNQEEIKRLESEKQKLKQETEDLKAQLQAKLEQKNKIAQATDRISHLGTGTAYAATVAIDCNNPTTAKAFLYCHESTNNPAAENAGGCFGLGQDCNGIVRARCGVDYACQDQYFTEYMLERYGSWEAAKSWWQSAVPINGNNVGNWW